MSIDRVYVIRLITECLRKDHKCENELRYIFTALGDDCEVDISSVSTDYNSFNSKKKLRHLLKAFCPLVKETSNGYVSDNGNELVKIFSECMQEARKNVPDLPNEVKRDSWMTHGGSIGVGYSTVNSVENVVEKPKEKSLLEMHQEGAFKGLDYKAVIRASKPGSGESRWGTHSAIQSSSSNARGLSGGNFYRIVDEDDGKYRNSFDPKRDMGRRLMSKQDFGRMVENSAKMKNMFSDPKLVTKFI